MCNEQVIKERIQELVNAKQNLIQSFYTLDGALAENQRTLAAILDKKKTDVPKDEPKKEDKKEDKK